MSNYKYSMENIESTESVKYAKAQGYNIDASYKDLTQVCSNIRRKEVQEAVVLLEKFVSMELPVRYTKFNKRLGHRHELGGKKGRYPRKSAKYVLKILKNAISNASSLGMGGKLIIAHCSANKQDVYPRVVSKGRWSRANYETSRVEIVLKEVS
ncbi:MAG: 50S ribosomal protein L22 [Candidatus Micrarchaeota archaeon]